MSDPSQTVQLVQFANHIRSADGTISARKGGAVDADFARTRQGRRVAKSWEHADASI